MSDEPNPESNGNRRDLLAKALGGAVVGAAALPHRWVKPVIEAVIVPAHAATSPATTTTTAAPTTTIAPTTTATLTTTPSPTTTNPVTTTPAPTTSIISVSDIRLKRDVSRVGALPLGLDLYRFKYLSGDQEYVGVMAQDVLRVLPEAVITNADGYLSVHYAALGAKMMHYPEWAALQLQSEPSEPYHVM